MFFTKCYLFEIVVGPEAVHQKPGRTVIRTTSRPLLGKVNGSKKRGPKKNIPPPNVRKGVGKPFVVFQFF